ncbi:hypothetical protein EHQ53_08680 [Leptospira langatensis]|uniref:Uncharacterized protein n=1 Tax=Leptospira langatensis TaxID=2484983 RepID=A0A5F1ZX73_9LEPT|nr:DUF5329 domain-containing protein [Leptospira langatensis]TGK01296.1 hypothetical protein EHO57_10190 [Leptospira langatensis]TGL42251.1 hypothetical protein EHQ53_08680 [Leptospira langatensis]
MKKTVSSVFCILVLSTASFLFAVEPDTEIRSLVASLDSCKGCVFIRNGSEHKLDEAKAHLLRKYDSAKSQIKTTEDFIRGIASKSSITGTPYKIRMADGKEIESEKWLFEKLNELRNPNASKQTPKKSK